MKKVEVVLSRTYPVPLKWLLNELAIGDIDEATQEEIKLAAFKYAYHHWEQEVYMFEPEDFVGATLKFIENESY